MGASAGDGGAHHQWFELASDRRDRVDELNTRILTEQDAKQALQDDITAAEAELAFLRGLGTASAAQLSAELMFAPDTTSDADALAGLLRTRIDAALESIRQARADMRDLDAAIDALRRELRQVQPARNGGPCATAPRFQELR